MKSSKTQYAILVTDNSDIKTNTHSYVRYIIAAIVLSLLCGVIIVGGLWIMSVQKSQAAEDAALQIENSLHVALYGSKMNTTTTTTTTEPYNNHGEVTDAVPIIEQSDHRCKCTAGYPCTSSCSVGRCCSEYKYCGSGPQYCGKGQPVASGMNAFHCQRNRACIWQPGIYYQQREAMNFGDCTNWCKHDGNCDCATYRHNDNMCYKHGPGYRLENANNDHQSCFFRTKGRATTAIPMNDDDEYSQETLD